MPANSTSPTFLMRMQGNHNDLAAEKLWNRIDPRVQRLSCRLLRRFNLPAVADEDDVTINMVATLYQDLKSRQFHELRNSDGLWKLLIQMIMRQVNDDAKTHRAKKRESGEVYDCQDFFRLNYVHDDQPEPSLEAMIKEQC